MVGLVTNIQLDIGEEVLLVDQTTTSVFVGDHDRKDDVAVLVSEKLYDRLSAGAVFLVLGVKCPYPVGYFVFVKKPLGIWCRGIVGFSIWTPFVGGGGPSDSVSAMK